MTILVMDAGNTRIKWATLAQGVLDNAGQASHQDTHTKDHFDAFAAQHWSTQPPPARVVVANVAGPDFANSLSGWIRQTWNIDTEFMTPQHAACGIHNAYLDPQKLGADRWAAMIAAHRNVKGPVCVIDCGTAITIDILTASGEHQGGLIVPGLTMMRRTLLANTQDIDGKMDDENQSCAILARDTQGGVNGGTLYTAISVIDRVTTDLATELGKNMTRVITGGDTTTLLPLLAGRYRHEPTLVLQGLAIFATENT